MNAPLRGTPPTPSFANLVHDDPAAGAFTVDRRVFTDPAVFEAEMRHIFEGTWVFVGLESQIAAPHDFVTTFIGRHPVLLSRDGEGRIGCFLNTCRHRGTVVCPFKQGQRRLHVCRYHGWTYDSAGRNVTVTDRSVGQYPPAFEQADLDLVRVPRLDSYRGFLFASLNADVPPLDTYLGEARVFLDLVIDASPTGTVAFLPGESSYTFDGNWKLQFENGLDNYHFATTHGAYVDILKRRAAEAPQLDMDYPAETDEPGQGSFNFPHGHAVSWSIKTAQVYGRPLLAEPGGFARLRERVGPVRAKWMMRQRNLTIFPNLQVIDILSTQVRTWRPLAPDRTEMISHCLAPMDEGDTARILRIRNYEDFFNPSGLATSDDNVMYEFCQTGYGARDAGPTAGYLRGLGAPAGGASPHAGELAITPTDWSFGPQGSGAETSFHAGYRAWQHLLRAADAT